MRSRLLVGTFSWMPPRCFRRVRPGEGFEADPGHAGGSLVSQLARELLHVPPGAAGGDGWGEGDLGLMTQSWVKG